jgi:class III poly(R)-hydroxyalkanoic acid synthase PhaE subunit
MSTQSPAAGFEALARQYWSAWGDAMRASPPNMGTTSGTAAGGNGGIPNWQDAIDWWSRMAQGGNADANAAVERFNAQARDWYGQMQQIAAQFAGRDAGAADIVAAWKRALGDLGGNPFPDMFRAMRGQGAQGFEQWSEAAQPYLEAWRKEGSSWLGMPTFGIGREHQQRWQKLAQAQLDYQQQEAAYNALMLQSSQRAYELFEQKLREREQPGRQLTTARALFDVWIDAAEEAYAQMALSPEFRAASGARVNAQMRLRQAVQGEVERTSALFGMPTRSDLDTAFRKIADLERSLRSLRDQLQGTGDSKPKTGTGKDSAQPTESRTANAGRAAKNPAKAPAAKSAARNGAATKGKRP